MGAPLDANLYLSHSLSWTLNGLGNHSSGKHKASTSSHLIGSEPNFVGRPGGVFRIYIYIYIIIIIIIIIIVIIIIVIIIVVKKTEQQLRTFEDPRLCFAGCPDALFVAWPFIRHLDVAPRVRDSFQTWDGRAGLGKFRYGLGR